MQTEHKQHCYTQNAQIMQLFPTAANLLETTTIYSEFIFPTACIVLA